MKKVESGLDAKLIKENKSIFGKKESDSSALKDSVVNDASKRTGGEKDKTKKDVKKDVKKEEKTKKDVKTKIKDKKITGKDKIKKDNDIDKIKKDNGIDKIKKNNDIDKIEKNNDIDKIKKDNGIDKIEKDTQKESKKRGLSTNNTQSKRQRTEKMKTPMSKIERKILTHGTVKDKINVLTLQVERNPSVENYKSLLQYAENQRNDVIYEILKNVRDLLLHHGACKDFYIKQKITKTFEINLRNIFIKKKVLKLVFTLLKNNIYFLELIYPFINKLGDKKELEEFVVENTKALFPVQEEVLLENLEDFFFKNASFKARLSLLKLLSGVSPTDKKNQVDLYLKFLTINLDLPEEQKMILLGYLLEGLSSTVELCSSDVEVSSSAVEIPPSTVEILKKAVCPSLSLHIFKILYYTKSSSTKDILYRLLSFPPSEELMALVFKYALEENDPKIMKYIFNRSLLYRKELVLAILFLINRQKMDLSNFFGLSLLSHHYSVVVRKTVCDMLGGRTVREIKPFDEIDVETYEQINE